MSLTNISTAVAPKAMKVALAEPSGALMVSGAGFVAPFGAALTELRRAERQTSVRLLDHIVAGIPKRAQAESKTESAVISSR